ncbi:TonB-dependent receptor [Alkalimonas delamerensis]|uniref:TonB-dependent receptor n=1 Tax=Alkalimonas delamerensis TaxID=265981 RepID=A0ABT9GNT1_9GAMM|nr:TonB-dependent receptor [Alkalimonas delamerensis]MDP4528612.1 TonB-dependent receptor [Alkalimonas delamerensis]
MHFKYSGAFLALATILAIPLAGHAQESNQATELERIQVTGSRIRQSELEGQNPVQVLDRDYIDRSGMSSIGDLLQSITASGSALNTRFNSSGNFGFPPDGGGVGAGASTVDLRHLGTQRVLVLVDGLRWVNESSASGVGGVVDLNTIPMAIVDRIEVLEDGASSIYGSDAIAGVVNIITKRAQDGASLSSRYGQFTRGDGEQSQIELSFGGESGRHSYFIAASFFDQKAVASNRRDQSSLPYPGTGNALGSAAIPAGLIDFIDPNSGQRQLLFPIGLNPGYDGSLSGCERSDQFSCFSNDDRFNYANYNLLQTPNKRSSLFAQQHYQLTDSTSWYMRGLYNQRKSTNQAAAEPFFIGTAVPTNFWADTLTIAADNPYNPFGFDLVAGGDDPNLLMLAYRPLEGGARRFEQTVDTFYLATGLSGDFSRGDRWFNWDINAAYSTNRASQLNFGSYNARRMATGLGPLANCEAEAGCVPLNVFGPGALTPEMLAYIQPVVRDNSENTLNLFSANLTGDLLSLPAGELAFATGWEYRKYRGNYRPDSLTVAGEYNGVVSSPTSGSYDVQEVYAELSIPLLRDLSLAEQLDLSLASRFSDYSTFGSEITSKAGVRWQLSSELLLRGSWAEGFRAPNIGELFGSASGFDAVLDDPCSEPSDASIQANCSALGVPASYVQPNPQIGVITGGNRELQPESSTSHNLGFVYSPEFASQTSWSERMDISMSWYRHQLKGAIQALDAQTQLNLCVQSLSNDFCGGIQRNALGAIDNFSNTLTNIGKIDTSGVDFDVSWLQPATDIGQLSVNWRTTMMNYHRVFDANNERQPRTVGVEVNNSGIPRFSSNLNLAFGNDSIQASWTLRYLSELTESCGRAASFAVCRNNPEEGQNRLGSVVYHDLQLSWQTEALLNGLQLTVGLNNLFGKEPPICLSCTLNGYDPSNYEMPGSRFWYLQTRLQF